MYKCLQSNLYSEGVYEITSLRKADIYKIKDWRNEQIDVLRQDKQLTDEDQLKYYNSIIEPTFVESSPRQILFSFLEKGNLIGYGGIVHIAWADKRGEISFLLDTERVRDKEKYRTDFNFYLKLIKRVAFEDIKLNRLFTETFDIRPLHISILEDNDFLCEGRMKQHVIIAGQFIDSLIHGCLHERYIKE